jgi:hypothetical protein
MQYGTAGKTASKHSRIDFGFTLRKDTSYGSREWYFQVMNITNHLNPLLYIAVRLDA